MIYRAFRKTRPVPNNVDSPAGRKTAMAMMFRVDILGARGGKRVDAPILFDI